MESVKPKAKDEYYCPILGELMKNPVSFPDGKNYEKQAITSWLAKNKTSPWTRQPMQSSQGTPNLQLKLEIQTYISENRNQKEKQITTNEQVDEDQTILSHVHFLS